MLYVRLKQVREGKGLTQSEAAEQIGIHPTQLSRLENTRSNFIALDKLEKVFRFYRLSSFDEVFEIDTEDGEENDKGLEVKL